MPNSLDLKLLEQSSKQQTTYEVFRDQFYMLVHGALGGGRLVKIGGCPVGLRRQRALLVG